MMRKQDWLTALQMGVSRDDCLGVSHREREKGFLKIENPIVNRLGFCSAVEPDVERDLVVPTSSSVKFCAGSADLFGQCPFDIHVNIFEACFETKLAAFDFLFDLAKAATDRTFLGLVDDTRIL
jgi:hypothetical protein